MYMPLCRYIYIQLLFIIIFIINVGGGRSSFKGMWKMEGIGAFTVLSKGIAGDYVASKSCDIFRGSWKLKTTVF